MFIIFYMVIYVLYEVYCLKLKMGLLICIICFKVEFFVIRVGFFFIIILRLGIVILYNYKNIIDLY